MQAVQKEQAADQLIAAKFPDERLADFTALVTNVQDSLERSSVQRHQRFKQFLGHGAGVRVGCAFELLDDFTDPLHAFVEVFVRRHILLQRSIEAGDSEGCGRRSACAQAYVFPSRPTAATRKTWSVKRAGQTSVSDASRAPCHCPGTCVR